MKITTMFILLLVLLVVSGVLCTRAVAGCLLDASIKPLFADTVCTGFVRREPEDGVKKASVSSRVDSLFLVNVGRMLKGERYIMRYVPGADAVTVHMNRELLGINGSLLDFDVKPGYTVIFYRGGRDSVFVFRRVDYAYDGGRSCALVGFGHKH